MKEIILFFAPDLEFLGELSVSEAGFGSCMLSQAGEKSLGKEIESMRLNGLKKLQSAFKVTPQETEHIMYEAVIQPRDPLFGCAFRDRILARGCQVITLPESKLAAWNKILDLPLDPRERYLFMSGLSCLEPAEEKKWLAAFDAARHETEKA